MGVSRCSSGGSLFFERDEFVGHVGSNDPGLAVEPRRVELVGLVGLVRLVGLVERRYVVVVQHRNRRLGDHRAGVEHLTLGRLVQEPALRQASPDALGELAARRVRWCLPIGDALATGDALTDILIYARAEELDALDVATLSRRNASAVAVAGLPVSDLAAPVPLIAMRERVSYRELSRLVAELGHGVSGWAEGDRVAVGWFGGSCGHCAACRRGDVVHCPQRQVPGVSYPGGWASSITVPGDAIVIGAGVAELVASNIAASPDHPDVRTSR